MTDYFNYSDTYEITIKWIRHGESCANLGQQIH